jgi:hypothetical protein
MDPAFSRVIHAMIKTPTPSMIITMPIVVVKDYCIFWDVPIYLPATSKAMPI